MEGLHEKLLLEEYRRKKSSLPQQSMRLMQCAINEEDDVIFALLESGAADNFKEAPKCVHREGRNRYPNILQLNPRL